MGMATGRLPPHCRGVLHLRYLHGMVDMKPKQPKCASCGDLRVTSLGPQNADVTTLRCIHCGHIWIACGNCLSIKLTDADNRYYQIKCNTCGHVTDFDHTKG